MFYHFEDFCSLSSFFLRSVAVLSILGSSTSQHPIIPARVKYIISLWLHCKIETVEDNGGTDKKIDLSAVDCASETFANRLKAIHSSINTSTHTRTHHMKHLIQ